MWRDQWSLSSPPVWPPVRTLLLHFVAAMICSDLQEGKAIKTRGRREEGGGSDEERKERERRRGRIEERRRDSKRREEVNGGEAKLQLHNMASYMYMYMTLHMYIIN